jgi:hypothetical protein
MATLRDVGDAAKGDKRGRRGGFKGNYLLSKFNKYIFWFSFF